MMTRAEHLLACLAEECDEVGQRAMKGLRFTLCDVQPGQGLNNAERLNYEIVDLLTVIEMLWEEGILPEVGLGLRAVMGAAKKVKIEKYMEYAHLVGALETKKGPPGQA